jgi:predicted HTH domain antitoxin
MCEVTMTIPDHSLLALNLAPEQVGDELRLAAAMKLYEVGRLSSGAAAELAGVPKPLFMLKLGEYGVDAFRLTKQDFDQETPVG